MSEHPTHYVEPDLEVHVVRAQALVEAVDDYERHHPTGTPCFSEALALMKAVCEP